MKKTVCFASLTLLCGCFTLHRSESPQVRMTRAPQGRDVKIAVSGFAASFTQFVPTYSYGTAYVDDGPFYERHGPHRGWYGRGLGHYETVTTETLVPQTSATDAFVRRAQSHLEDNGFLVRAPNPEFTVDVAFAGPYVTSSERAIGFAWMFCSIFSAEYSVASWTAKLKIYDNKTGRAVFTKDYSVRFEDVVWSPLFFIGLSGYGENTYNYMQNWCLTSLTDQTVAGATAFLAR